MLVMVVGQCTDRTPTHAARPVLHVLRNGFRKHVELSFVAASFPPDPGLGKAGLPQALDPYSSSFLSSFPPIFPGINSRQMQSTARRGHVSPEILASVQRRSVYVYRFIG